MALEWPQHFSHYKSMRIFPDAQGQLTPQSEVEPSRNSNSYEMLVYDNFDLQVTSYEKVLGVNIDDNLTWTNHFQYVTKKISTNLWLLSQIKSYLPLKHRMIYYNAYIKPHLEYCCVIWGNSFNSNLYKIEKLQRRACKIILGKDYKSLDDARRQLNMLSFEELVFINKAKVMFKVTHGLSPIYIIGLSHIRVSTHVSTAYRDTKGTSHVRRRYVGIRSSYSSIRSSYSSYAEVLRFFYVCT